MYRCTGMHRDAPNAPALRDARGKANMQRTKLEWGGRSQ